MAYAQNAQNATPFYQSSTAVASFMVASAYFALAWVRPAYRERQARKYLRALGPRRKIAKPNDPLPPLPPPHPRPAVLPRTVPMTYPPSSEHPWSQTEFLIAPETSSLSAREIYSPSKFSPSKELASTTAWERDSWSLSCANLNDLDRPSRIFGDIPATFTPRPLPTKEEIAKGRNVYLDDVVDNLLKQSADARLGKPPTFRGKDITPAIPVGEDEDDPVSPVYGSERSTVKHPMTSRKKLYINDSELGYVGRPGGIKNRPTQTPRQKTKMGKMTVDRGTSPLPSERPIQRHSGSKRYIIPEDRHSKRMRSVARMPSLLYEADAESGESDDTAMEREFLVNRHRRLRKRDVTEFSGRDGHLNDKAKKRRLGMIRMPADSLWRPDQVHKEDIEKENVDETPGLSSAMYTPTVSPTTKSLKRAIGRKDTPVMQSPVSTMPVRIKLPTTPRSRLPRVQAALKGEIMSKSYGQAVTPLRISISKEDEEKDEEKEQETESLVDTKGKGKETSQATTNLALPVPTTKETPVLATMAGTAAEAASSSEKTTLVADASKTAAATAAIPTAAAVSFKFTPAPSISKDATPVQAISSATTIEQSKAPGIPSFSLAPPAPIVDTKSAETKSATISLSTSVPAVTKSAAPLAFNFTMPSAEKRGEEPVTTHTTATTIASPAFNFQFGAPTTTNDKPTFTFSGATTTTASVPAASAPTISSTATPAPINLGAPSGKKPATSIFGTSQPAASPAAFTGFSFNTAVSTGTATTITTTTPAPAIAFGDSTGFGAATPLKVTAAPTSALAASTPPLGFSFGNSATPTTTTSSIAQASQAPSIPNFFAIQPTASSSTSGTANTSSMTTTTTTSASVPASMPSFSVPTHATSAAAAPSSTLPGPFGLVASSTTSATAVSAPPMFGAAVTAPATSATQSSMFSAPSGTPVFTFGQTTATSTAPAPSIFGSSNTSTVPTSSATFGTQSTTSQPTFGGFSTGPTTFGATSTPASAPTFTFGLMNTTAASTPAFGAPSTSSATSNSQFGSSTSISTSAPMPTFGVSTASSTIPTPVFGTQAAGTQSIFGAPASSAPTNNFIFGPPSTTSSTSTSTAPFQFGAPSSAFGATSSATPSASVFGVAQPPAGGSTFNNFGGKQPTAPGTFGTPQQPAANSFSFGSTATATPATPSSFTQNTQNTFNGTFSTPTQSSFGQQSGGFGGAAQSQQNNGFGSTAQPQPQPQQGSAFGGAAQSQQGGGFGGTAQPQPNSVFGSATQPQQPFGFGQQPPFAQQNQNVFGTPQTPGQTFGGFGTQSPAPQFNFQFGSAQTAGTLSPNVFGANNGFNTGQTLFTMGVGDTGDGKRKIANPKSRFNRKK